MKTPHRPRRAKKKTLKQKLNQTIRRLRQELRAVRLEVKNLEGQLDTTRSQMRRTVKVNHFNAAAHRASEVAALRQNHELQVAQAQLAGRPVHPELAAAAREVPALKVPAPIPVKKISLSDLVASTGPVSPPSTKASP